ncbi:MAG: hypothetical protein IH614_19875 [Desulfuromonadales bacterium]|nr:hypothetical protein [Desulfuromonadales bacterium]
MATSPMRRLSLFLLWSCVFLALLVALDQLLLRLDFKSPPLRAVQTFHHDFRSRLLGLPSKADSPPPAAERQRPSASDQPPAPGAPPLPGYVYVDESGDLQFVDTLQEVPRRYRGEARPLQP